MSGIEDLFTNNEETEPEKPKSLGVPVNIEIDCSECTGDTDSFYDKSKKLVSVVCVEGHLTETEMDLSWLVS